MCCYTARKRAKAGLMSKSADINIPFCKPDYGPAERAAIETAMCSGKLEGGGAMAQKCENWFEARTGCARALITPSCTASLEMMALALDLQAGDEVIMPSFTFVSSAGAFALRGAVPVFVDIDPQTFNLDVDAARAAITPQTKAVLLVHYAGVGCEMEAFVDLCLEHGLVLLEDAAQAIGATWNGRPLGTFGAMSAFSFHHTKNITCGEGGALLVNDAGLIRSCEMIRDKGTNRADFLRRQIAKYEWHSLGSSYQLSELASAVLSEQLLRIELINTARLRLWTRYAEALGSDNRLQTPFIPKQAGHNAHIYSVLLSDRAQRDACAVFLRARGIVAAPHYVPLHLTPGGRKYGRAHGSLGVTLDVAARQLRLPLFATMRGVEQDAVMRALNEFLDSYHD